MVSEKAHAAPSHSLQLTAAMPLISQMSVLNVPAEQKAEQVGVQSQARPFSSCQWPVMSH